MSAHPDISVRKARVDELKTIQDLNFALFKSDSDKDEYLNLNWPYEEEGETYFRKKITGEEGVCFVATIGDEVIGYVACGIQAKFLPRPVKRTELENIFVMAEYRSHGVGEQLVKEFFAWSKEQTAEVAFVSAYALNERAIKFYQNMGFEPYETGLEIKFKAD